MNSRSSAQRKASPEEYYTVPEAATLLKVSPSTVWRWIEAGRLPAHRVGLRGIRISREALESVVTPSRRKEKMKEAVREPLWAGYDPRKVEEALASTAGSWRDLDPDALIAELYRAREEGTVPPDDR